MLQVRAYEITVLNTTHYDDKEVPFKYPLAQAGPADQAWNAER